MSLIHSPYVAIIKQGKTRNKSAVSSKTTDFEVQDLIVHCILLFLQHSGLSAKIQIGDK